MTSGPNTPAPAQAPDPTAPVIAPKSAAPRAGRRTRCRAADPGRRGRGGAVAVARQLPGRLGETVLAPATRAFTHSLDMAAAGAAATMLGTAVLCLVLLRGVRTAR
ncbi:hypothetical protein [Streptomyces sp. NPDC001948]